MFSFLSNDRPDVIVDFIFEQGLLFIGLSNIWKAPAYGISVQFSCDIMGVEGSKSIFDMSFFRNVEFMPPQKRVVTFLDSSAAYFRREQPAEIETIVAFKDRRGRSFRNLIKHNLEIYRDVGYIG